jgi:hypothetical protein
MPKDTYTPGQGGGQTVEPLEAGQYPDCVLDKITAFRQNKKDDQTGNEYLQTKLALYWHSGYNLPDSEEPFYLVDGFVTFSFHERANFAKMLATLGFIKPGDPVEFEYDLGGNHAGRGFDALPIYAGTGPKGDVEVPVESLKINGQELIGTTATLIVSIKDSGYNKIDLVMKPSPKAPARLGPRKASDFPKAEAPVNVSARKKAAQGYREPLWLTWRNRTNAIRWAATLKNPDGSLAYQTQDDAELVWQSLYPIFEQEVFEPTEREFYWHWQRWHDKAIAGENFSFNDEPTPDEAKFLYEVRGRHA